MRILLSFGISLYNILINIYIIYNNLFSQRIMRVYARAHEVNFVNFKQAFPVQKQAIGCFFGAKNKQLVEFLGQKTSICLNFRDEKTSNWLFLIQAIACFLVRKYSSERPKNGKMKQAFVCFFCFKKQAIGCF